MIPIILENKKLYDLIMQKDALVNSGRKISRDIEMIEIKIKRFEEKEKRITSKVIPPLELTARGDELIKQLQKLDKELTDIANKINDYKLAQVPLTMKDDHQKLMKEREHCERERNKIALKVQKIKDKCVPIIQKEVKPMLKDKYDDIETAKAENGKITIATFNHLEDWKKKFGR